MKKNHFYKRSAKVTYLHNLYTIAMTTLTASLTNIRHPLEGHSKNVNFELEKKRKLKSKKKYYIISSTCLSISNREK